MVHLENIAAPVIWILHDFDNIWINWAALIIDISNDAEWYDMSSKQNIWAILMGLCGRKGWDTTI